MEARRKRTLSADSASCPTSSMRSRAATRASWTKKLFVEAVVTQHNRSYDYPQQHKPPCLCKVGQSVRVRVAISQHMRGLDMRELRPYGAVQRQEELAVNGVDAGELPYHELGVTLQHHIISQPKLPRSL